MYTFIFLFLNNSLYLGFLLNYFFFLVCEKWIFSIGNKDFFVFRFIYFANLVESIYFGIGNFIKYFLNWKLGNLMFFVCMV